MKKIDFDSFKCGMYKDDCLYSIEIKYNDYIIKRIKKEKNNIKYMDYITISNNKVQFKNYIYFYRDKMQNLLSKEEKDDIIEDIFNTLEKNNIINDVLDLDKLKEFIYNSQRNYLISNGNIALTYNDNNNILDVVLIDSNITLGKIIINSADILIDDYYFEDTLKLFKNYICLFKKDNVLKKILK